MEHEELKGTPWQITPEVGQVKPVPEPMTTPIQSRSDISVPVQLAIETRRGVLPSVKISAFTLIAPVYTKMYCMLLYVFLTYRILRSLAACRRQRRLFPSKGYGRRSRTSQRHTPPLCHFSVHPCHSRHHCSQWDPRRKSPHSLPLPVALLHDYT